LFPDSPAHSLVTVPSKPPGLFKKKVFTLYKTHPGDTPEQFELGISCDWTDSLALGVGKFLCAFTASAAPAFCAVTVKVKMPTMEWRRAACFFRSFKRWKLSLSLPHTLSLSLSLSIPFVTDYSSSFPAAAIVALNSCTTPGITTNTFSCPNPRNKAVCVPQSTSHVFNYKNNWTPVWHGEQL